MTATISHTRLRVLFAFFVVASLLLSARLAYWQTVGRADLLSRATDQVHSDLVVAAERGAAPGRARFRDGAEAALSERSRRGAGPWLRERRWGRPVRRRRALCRRAERHAGTPRRGARSREP